MPQQRPGRSKQDYQTPPEFIAALKLRLAIDNFSIDLAATVENRVALFHYDEGMDALADRNSWNPAPGGWAFLNPPYSNIAPWVAKAYREGGAFGAHIAMLVPASTGANWWRDYVHRKAHVLFLNGRLTFVGATGPYPKDCALLLYTPHTRGGYEVWHWSED